MWQRPSPSIRHLILSGFLIGSPTLRHSAPPVHLSQHLRPRSRCSTLVSLPRPLPSPQSQAPPDRHPGPTHGAQNPQTPPRRGVLRAARRRTRSARRCHARARDAGDHRR
ncbi:hypothetical protein B0H14DRAFT_2704363, partial [Mycena olivaceomarginata]